MPFVNGKSISLVLVCDILSCKSRYHDHKLFEFVAMIAIYRIFIYQINAFMLLIKLPGY